MTHLNVKYKRKEYIVVGKTQIKRNKYTKQFNYSVTDNINQHKLCKEKQIKNEYTIIFNLLNMCHKNKFVRSMLQGKQISITNKGFIF